MSVSECFIAEALTRITHTAVGYDDVPHWFSFFTFAISPIFCKFINTCTSVSRGFITDYWKKAFIDKAVILASRV